MAMVEIEIDEVNNMTEPHSVNHVANSSTGDEGKGKKKKSAPVF